MIKNFLKFTTITTTILLSISAFAEHPTSFSSAKRTLSKIYTDQDKTFYCGCDMSYIKTNKLKPELSTCGYEVRKQEKRANRIEWEHIMAAWDFGRQKPCWKEGGRKLCGKDPEFKKMESDMHNLVPAIGEVNGDRSNRPLTMVANPIEQYGACDMTVSFEEDKAMPPENVRGDVARVMFYMHDTYNMRMSKQDYQIYKAWNNSDPVSKEEKRIHDLKAKKQGNTNPYVTGEKSVNDFKY